MTSRFKRKSDRRPLAERADRADEPSLRQRGDEAVPAAELKGLDAGSADYRRYGKKERKAESFFFGKPRGEPPR